MVMNAGRAERLSKSQDRIFSLLFKRFPQFVDKTVIIDTGWILDPPDDSTFYTMMTQLRRRLEGVGYTIRSFSGQYRLTPVDASAGPVVAPEGRDCV